MKNLKILLVSSTLTIATLFIAGCGNTHVSGSVSYGAGYGSGYPMYYGNGYYNHRNVVVVRPPIHNRPRPRVRR